GNRWATTGRASWGGSGRETTASRTSTTSRAVTETLHRSRTGIRWSACDERGRIDNVERAARAASRHERHGAVPRTVAVDTGHVRRRAEELGREGGRTRHRAHGATGADVPARAPVA